MSTDIEVCVKGHMVYCKNEHDELYQFFTPINKKYMTHNDAQALTDLRHKVLSVERYNRRIKVDYYDLIKIARPEQSRTNK